MATGSFWGRDWSGLFLKVSWAWLAAGFGCGSLVCSSSSQEDWKIWIYVKFTFVDLKSINLGRDNTSHLGEAPDLYLVNRVAFKGIEELLCPLPSRQNRLTNIRGCLDFHSISGFAGLLIPGPGWTDPTLLPCALSTLGPGRREFGRAPTVLVGFLVCIRAAAPW